MVGGWMDRWIDASRVESGTPIILCIFSTFFFLSSKYTIDSERGQEAEFELSVLVAPDSVPPSHLPLKVMVLNPPNALTFSAVAVTPTVKCFDATSCL